MFYILFIVCITLFINESIMILHGNHYHLHYFVNGPKINMNNEWKDYIKRVNSYIIQKWNKYLDLLDDNIEKKEYIKKYILVTL
jgi:hypothetical protein